MKSWQNTTKNNEKNTEERRTAKRSKETIKDNSAQPLQEPKQGREAMSKQKKTYETIEQHRKSEEREESWDKLRIAKNHKGKNNQDFKKHRKAKSLEAPEPEQGKVALDLVQRYDSQCFLLNLKPCFHFLVQLPITLVTRVR